MVNDALNKRVFQSLFDRSLSPGILFRFGFGLLLYGISKHQQTFCRVGPPVEQNIFDKLQKILWNFLVHGELAGIHNSHVKPRTDSMVQKRGMHDIAYDVVSTE